MADNSPPPEETAPSAALDQLLYEQAPEAWALHDILRRAFTGATGRSRPFPTDTLSVIDGMEKATPGAKRAILDVQRATGSWTAALHASQFGRPIPDKTPHC